MAEVSNVLFITADQWRGDCLSAVDHPCVRTPNLDALARDGTLFTNHYTQASPCGPARTSLYTGMYMMNHRSVGNGTPLDARHTNIALEVRRAGFDPALFGYTDTSADPRQFAPEDPVLTTYEGVLPGMNPVAPLTSDPTPWLERLAAKGYAIPEDLEEIFTPTSGEQAIGAAAARYRPEDSDTAYLTDEVLAHISARPSQSWFVHLSYRAPHPPLIAPEPYNTLYDPSMVPAPVRAPSLEDEATQHPWLAYRLHKQLEPGAADHVADLPRLSPNDHRQLRATYYGLVSEVDDQIGRVLERLRSTGAYDNTLIVFTSDHGDQLGDHWLYGKHGYFDQAFHVPLIIRVPRSIADSTNGRTVTEFTEHVDIMPTILSWLGLSVPRQCDGASLLPFLRGERVTGWRDEVHWEFDFRDVAHGEAETALGLRMDQCTLNVIRDRRYKYVHFTALPPLLFDLQEDPHEFRNLADDAAYAAVALEYAQKMLSWRMHHDERTLTGIKLGPQGVIGSGDPDVV